jgi:hypothetical protein
MSQPVRPPWRRIALGFQLILHQAIRIRNYLLAISTQPEIHTKVRLQVVDVVIRCCAQRILIWTLVLCRSRYVQHTYETCVAVASTAIMPAHKTLLRIDVTMTMVIWFYYTAGDPAGIGTNKLGVGDAAVIAATSFATALTPCACTPVS